MHVCVQGSRLDSSTHARACTHTHAYARMCVHTHVHTIMISSSLGRCTSAAQRGGNITFLFLWKCGNMDIVFLFMLLFHLLSHGITFISHYGQCYNTSYLRCKLTPSAIFEYFKNPSPVEFHRWVLQKHFRPKQFRPFRIYHRVSYETD